MSYLLCDSTSASFTLFLVSQLSHPILLSSFLVDISELPRSRPIPLSAPTVLEVSRRRCRALVSLLLIRLRVR